VIQKGGHTVCEVTMSIIREPCGPCLICLTVSYMSLTSHIPIVTQHVSHVLAGISQNVLILCMYSSWHVLSCHTADLVRTRKQRRDSLHGVLGCSCQMCFSLKGMHCPGCWQSPIVCWCQWDDILGELVHRDTRHVTVIHRDTVTKYVTVIV
jgi:hypothetical protein